VNPYFKGAIGAAIVIAALFTWYRANDAKLPVNQSPVGFQLLDQMEKTGLPDFELDDLAGHKRKFSEFQADIVVLNFWASWCNPCVQEFPSMLKLVKHMKGKVVVVAVSTDDNADDINAFTKAFKLPQPNFYVLWDKEKTVMKTFGVEKMPESFLAGRGRKLIRKVMGIEDWSSANALDYFDSLLRSGNSYPAKGK
jgi:cytochrome c biogenesis protein CcmG/thiol:disulfide interchange protein DsbE